MRPELQRLGEHGLRPLLDVLASTGAATSSASRWRCSAAIGNPSAAPALFKLAQSPARARRRARIRFGGSSRVDLREEAALAGGAGGAAPSCRSSLKLYADPEKQLRVAAAYGLGRRRRQAAPRRRCHGARRRRLDVQARPAWPGDPRRGARARRDDRAPAAGRWAAKPEARRLRLRARRRGAARRRRCRRRSAPPRERRWRRRSAKAPTRCSARRPGRSAPSAATRPARRWCAPCSSSATRCAARRRWRWPTVRS